MVIEFEARDSDLVAFNRYFLTRRRTLIRGIRSLWVPAAIVIFAVLLADGDWKVRVLETFGLLFLVYAGARAAQWLVLFVFAPTFAPRHMRRVDPTGGTGPRKLELTDDGVRETSPLGEHAVAWSGLSCVEQTTEYIFLFFAERAAFVVPKAAFESESQATAFFELASTQLGRHTPRTKGA